MSSRVCSDGGLQREREDVWDLVTNGGRGWWKGHADRRRGVGGKRRAEARFN